MIESALPSAPGVLTAEELITTLVRDEDRVARAVIDECARRGDAILDVLAPLATEDAWYDDLTTGEWWLRFHAAMILGLVPSERAGQMLVELMRQMDAAEDDNIQDWLAGRWPELFRNKPDPALTPLRALAEDRRCDWYIRVQAVESAVACAANRSAEALSAASDWTADLVAPEDEDWDFRVVAASTLLDYPHARHRPLLEYLAREQPGQIPHFDLRDVASAFGGTETRQHLKRFDPWSFYSPEEIAARQARWAEADAEEDSRPEPVVHAAVKTGRNDPCPCGSGRKYKRCCLE